VGGRHRRGGYCLDAYLDGSLMMTPALGLFEAGLIRRKNGLSVIVQTFFGLAILSTLWFVIGFTFVFAPSQEGIIGGLDFLFFNNIPLSTVLDYAPTIPGVTFVSFQMMFAVITPTSDYRSFCRENEVECIVIFIIAWSVLIYYPLAHWVWGKGG
jgi:Amt family ammonium transporter